MHETRAEANAAGRKHYWSDKACAHGHVGLRYVSTGHCLACDKARSAARRAASRAPPASLVCDYTGNKARMFDNLLPRAQAEAIRLGIANNHYSLKYAAAHDSEKLQVRALNSQVRQLAQKAERKRLGEMTIRQQAEAAAGAAPRVVQHINHAREATTACWAWLLEEFGERGWQVVNRLREVDVRLLLEIADRARTEGAAPAPRLH